MKIANYVRNIAVFDQVKAALVRAGFECALFQTETALLRTLRRDDFDLIIIDMPLTPRDDDSMFSWLNHRSGERTPTIIISPINHPEIIALALDSGADDFMVRPFEPVELVARINALLRRCAPPNMRRAIELAEFSFNRETGKSSFRDIPIVLTPREFSMAWLFFSSPGIYISRETIGAVIWNTGSEIAGRTIEQHIYKLRKKLQIGEERTIIIRTAYSQGYRLEVCS